jgi:hypothetical protein
MYIGLGTVLLVLAPRSQGHLPWPSKHPTPPWWNCPGDRALPISTAHIRAVMRSPTEGGHVETHLSRRLRVSVAWPCDGDGDVGPCPVPEGLRQAFAGPPLRDGRLASSGSGSGG